MPKRNIYFDFGYLLSLAVVLGGVLTLGAIVAPVIFHSDAYTVGMMLDHYNMGIVMGEIFRRFAYVVYFIVIYVLVYESYMYKIMQIDKIAILSAFGVVFSGLLFSAVYVPKILEFQKLGAKATQSDTFANIHTASEIDFKILAVALAILFVRRLMLLPMGRKTQ